MTSELESQNLIVARKFIEQFLGKGDVSIAEKVLDKDVQAITGLKPDGPINGRDQYKHIFSAFSATNLEFEMLMAPSLTPLILK